MSHSPAIPVQNEPLDQQPKVVKVKPAMLTLVKILENISTNKEAIIVVLNLYGGLINDIVSVKMGENLLLWALRLRYDMIVDELLKTNIDKNAEDITGSNALIYATIANDLKTVQALLKFPCDTSHSNNNKNTALIISISKCNFEISLLLINAGFNPMIRNSNYKCAFDYIDTIYDKTVFTIHGNAYKEKIVLSQNQKNQLVMAWLVKSGKLPKK